MTLLTFFAPRTSSTGETELRADAIYDPIIAGDSIELQVFPFDQETPATSSDVTSAQFTIKEPDGTTTTSNGTIQSDGSAFLRFTSTTQIGRYLWMVRFIFTSGEIRSYTSEFRTYDPLVSDSTRVGQVEEEVWMRLEDCFDSELGGPWLRDRTLAYFDKTKVSRFVPEGLLLVNSWPPATGLDLGYFTTDVPETDPALIQAGQTTEPDPDRIVIVQATLLAVIRHLMRSYTEQPNPQGGQIVWQDRRDYLQRWSTIYQIEKDFFEELIKLWKRQFYNFGQGKLLVTSKAGRLWPTGWRARNSARGYW